MTTILQFIVARDINRRKDLLFLTVLFGIAFFLLLGHFALIEPDEGRYAEIPREMLERGDFITPVLNYVKYFEKPVLLYWLNAISFFVFGQNEFAARFPSALAGLLTVLLTYHTGRTLFGRREGMMAALILGSSVGFLVQGRYNIIDMTLTFCMTATLACFIMAVQAEVRWQGRYYYLMYFFAALTVLAKGLIGIVLPGFIIAGYILLSRRWSILREMRLVTGTLLFLLIAAPWFVLVSLKNPEFARFFFIHEHFERFLTKVHKRYEPPWFFIPVLIGCMLPWSFFFPSAALSAWRERRSTGADALLFLALWVILIFGFFSASNSKLIPYILPVFPALALLTGRAFAIAAELPGRVFAVTVPVLGAVLCIMGAGLLLYPHLVEHAELSVVACTVGGVLFGAEGVILLAGMKRFTAVTLFVTLFLFSMVIEVVMPPFLLGKFVEERSSKKLGLIARTHMTPDTTIVSIGYDHTLTFYTGRRVVILGGPGELEFGSKQGDQSAWFIGLPEFTALWKGPSPVLFSIDQELLPYFTSILGPHRILGQQGRKLLISNRTQQGG
jgi:4-amino-4-deoxy-L-arabinose transferase-like glycosyltransferase